MDATEDASEPTARSRRTRLPWPVVAAATALALVAAVATYAALSGDDDPSGAAPGRTLELRPESEVADGDPMNIAFTWDDDTTGTLADAVDGPTVVNFFASWCPPCVAEMPDLEEVSRQFEGRVGFFGLAVQDRPEDAAEIVASTGITYPWARDIRGDIVNAAGVVTMPTTLFVDADGDIVHIRAGAVDRDELIDLIAEHLGVVE